MRCLAVGLLLVASTPVATADRWFVFEAPVAVVTSDVQAQTFRTGALPAIGGYVENERFALGLRLRAGVLRDGAPPMGNVADPGVGGLITTGIAVRIAISRGWVEVVGGGGVTGRDIVPSAELGVGWIVATGRVDVGVSARHTWVVSRDTSDAFGTARMVLAGVDLRFGKQRAVPVRPPTRIASEPVRVEVASDADHIVEREETCVHDVAGCPEVETIQVSEEITVRGDRIVLDERVLFALDRARVRSNGRAVLAQLARLWREHPEWIHLTVEGHTDVRGTDDYNQRLSKLRADRVIQAMIALGCSVDAMTSVGFGRERPRARGTDEASHERNRRVEFVIERRQP